MLLMDNYSRLTQQERFLIEMGIRSRKSRRGIGTALIHAALQAIKDRAHITKISLSVNAQQEPTIKLYESMGFIKVGLLIHIKVDDKYYDEYMMEKYII